MLTPENAQRAASRRRVAFGQHFLEKIMTCSFRHCALIFSSEESAPSHAWCAAWLRWRLWRRRIMNPRRFATVAAVSCGTVVLAGWVVASIAGFGSAGIEITAAVPIEDRRAPSLTADAELAVAPPATAMGNAAVANAAVANNAVANAAVASAEV